MVLVPLLAGSSQEKSSLSYFPFSYLSRRNKKNIDKAGASLNTNACLCNEALVDLRHGGHCAHA
jgi:hypothetical protein